MPARPPARVQRRSLSRRHLVDIAAAADLNERRLLLLLLLLPCFKPRENVLLRARVRALAHEHSYAHTRSPVRARAATFNESPTCAPHHQFAAPASTHTHTFTSKRASKQASSIARSSTNSSNSSTSAAKRALNHYDNDKDERCRANTRLPPARARARTSLNRDAPPATARRPNHHYSASPPPPRSLATQTTFCRTCRSV